MAKTEVKKKTHFKDEEYLLEYNGIQVIEMNLN